MIEIRFYTTEAGNEPVREWLRSLDILEKKDIGNDLQTVQLGWEHGFIGEPLVKSLSSGLFEVRSTLSSSKRITRIFFCVFQKKIILLHAFVKKTQKTPDKEIELARKRQASLKNKVM